MLLCFLLYISKPTHVHVRQMRVRMCTYLRLWIQAHTHIHTCMQRAPAIARHAPLRFRYCICNCGTWTPEGASLPAFHAKVRGGWEYMFCLPAFYAKVRPCTHPKPAIYAKACSRHFIPPAYTPGWGEVGGRAALRNPSRLAARRARKQNLALGTPEKTSLILKRLRTHTHTL